MSARVIVSFLAAAFALGLLPGPAVAEERTVVGTIVRLDPAGGVLVVRDAAGASWSYKVEADAGIDLSIRWRPGGPREQRLALVP